MTDNADNNEANNGKKEIPQLIRDSWAKGSPTEWFETLYARAAKGEMRVPWAHMQANPDMVEWLDERQITGEGQKALVIGCGLGDDAEELAARGFAVTAFDISESAIYWCKERFPETTVNYVVADLLNLPDAWQGAFDLVLESRTVQALPYDLNQQASTNIGKCVALGGTLLFMCHARDPEEEARGIPWPLSTKELAVLEAIGFKVVQFEDYSKNGLRRFRITYKR